MNQSQINEAIRECVKVAMENDLGTNYDPNEWVEKGCRYMLAYLMKYGYLKIETN